jgi:hypothetical protein
MSSCDLMKDGVHVVIKLVNQIYSYERKVNVNGPIDSNKNMRPLQHYITLSSELQQINNEKVDSGQKRRGNRLTVITVTDEFEDHWAT